jgi:multidrug efflux pump subunit AcrA (membrane-fusion protein)
VQADQLLITGVVTSAGVLDLNFPSPGVVQRVLVHVGQRVAARQLLATEADPGEAAIEAADATAVAADEQQVRGAGHASLAPERAQLARDRSRLAADRQLLAERRIVAPAAGVINAVDAGPGQTAEPDGIADELGQAGPVAAPPLFSLLPEAPQASAKGGSAPSATLPMIQLRAAGGWEVLALVPQSSAGRVRAGQPVTVSIPAAHLTGLDGVVREVLATPVNTADGDMYEAIVTVSSPAPGTPLDGMTANVALTRRAAR